MKSLEKRSDEFMDSLNENEIGIVICASGGGKNFSYANYASIADVGACIATILSDYYDDGEKHARTLAEGIVIGISSYIKNGGKGSPVVASEVIKTSTERIRKDTGDMIKILSNAFKEIEDEDEDEDEDEKCEDCKGNKTCPLPQAVKYRKENGIREPMKKRGRGCHEEENGN